MVYIFRIFVADEAIFFSAAVRIAILLSIRYIPLIPAMNYLAIQ